MKAILETARRETLKHFGRVVQLYTPLYLSNACVNRCAYCGFNQKRGIKRVTLNLEQIEQEAKYLNREGFQHILLLTGEDRQAVPVDYLAAAVKKVKEIFVSVSIEVYPLSEAEYKTMVEAGVDGLTIYQETYHRPTYKKVHLAGPKMDYAWRYGAPERAAQAGIRRVGIGFLLGLYDWRFETAALDKHLRYLLKKFWQTQFQISFPRLNPAETGFKSRWPVSDHDFLQLLCEFRLRFPEIGFTLSTRESAAFRDRIFPYGITQMSAGSKTYPGAYALGLKSGKQFEIADPRSPRQVAKALSARGYEPVWKDWERAFT